MMPPYSIELELRGAEQVTVIRVPVGVVELTVGEIETVAPFTFRLVSMLLAREAALLDVLPSVAQTFAASKAAVVSACFKKTALAVMIAPNTRMKMTGKQTASSTEAVPCRLACR